MRVGVDLARCQTYGQCVFAAPDVFALRGLETMEFDYAPDERQADAVLRAQAACPVAAISVQLGGPGESVTGATGER